LGTTAEQQGAPACETFGGVDTVMYRFDSLLPLSAGLTLAARALAAKAQVCASGWLWFGARSQVVVAAPTSNAAGPSNVALKQRHSVWHGRRAVMCARK
jgi:hypothetical protein